ncbi:MAG: L-histidine N(alpha)-methyltransferase [Zoogloeaceae bacterium]|nr:L-histidine N(alpha)-methyltransferase [Zoogloeaceae bacterium]
MNAPMSPDAELAAFARDIRDSLSASPRRLSSRYLYDSLGSALFEAICELPWYRLTRAETTLLERHGADILAASAPLRCVVELGPGSGAKLACLLGARDAQAPLDVHLIDVSASALDAAHTRLSTLPGLAVFRHEVSYEAGLAEVEGAAGPKLVLMLGSNIGNFDRPGALAMLRAVRAAMRAGDRVLIGVDLVKSEREMLLAYDDPLGVTAAFDRNVLLRINRELGGDFDLSAFDYRVTWNAKAARIEAWLVSTRAQTVRIPAARLELTLAEGEPIWIESAHKYTRDGMFALLGEAGFVEQECWENTEDGFALALAGCGE